jgi:hypothetical protein
MEQMLQGVRKNLFPSCAFCAFVVFYLHSKTADNVYQRGKNPVPGPHHSGIFGKKWYIYGGEHKKPPCRGLNKQPPNS